MLESNTARPPPPSEGATVRPAPQTAISQSGCRRRESSAALVGKVPIPSNSSRRAIRPASSEP
jgi:hypothetical protein